MLAPQSHRRLSLLTESAINDQCSPTVDEAPLRILVAADVPPDPNAGASGTVFQMNAALRRLGHQVDEIWSPELGRRIRHGNLHYLLELPFTYRKAMRHRLKHNTYDVVEFNQPHAYLAAAEYRRRRLPGVFINRSHGHEVRSEEALQAWRHECGVPSPKGMRGMVSRWIRVLLDRQWKRIARSADGFHVSCREDGQFLQERYGVPSQRIGIISQGVPDLFLDQPVLPMTAARLRRMLYVGQLAFFKAPMMLATTVSQLLTAHPDLSMTWVCSRTHHNAARQLLAESVRSRVTFLDWMSQDELMSVLDQHGLFLFPSFFEGFGKAPLEAMSRGLCVVATETGGMRDFITDKATGRLVPIGSPEAITLAVEELLGNLADAELMSVKARHAAEHHRWDRCAQDLTRFYRQLLHTKMDVSTKRTAGSLS
jgi:glycosyltransferase involved in cell wall biosynthesis